MPHLRPFVALLSLGVLVVPLLTACGPPRDPDESPRPPVPAPAGPVSPDLTEPLPPLPSLPATPTGGFPEDRAVSCDGQPSGEEVLALLRTEQVLAPDIRASVASGPMCAGQWQYTVIDVPELDPLQVVTRGEPGALELVTAGTDVCTVDVRILAPSGIRTAAACVG